MHSSKIGALHQKCKFSSSAPDLGQETEGGAQGSGWTNPPGDWQSAKLENHFSTEFHCERNINGIELFWAGNRKWVCFINSALWSNRKYKIKAEEGKGGRAVYPVKQSPAMTCINRKHFKLPLLPKVSQQEAPSSAPPLEEGIRGPNHGPHSFKVPATPLPKGEESPVRRCAHSYHAGSLGIQPKRPRTRSQAFPRAAGCTLAWAGLPQGHRLDTPTRGRENWCVADWEPCFALQDSPMSGQARPLVCICVF